MKRATAVTDVLLVAIGVLHLARVFSGAQVTVDGLVIPMWASVPGTLVPLGFAFGVWWEHRAPRVGRSPGGAR